VDLAATIDRLVREHNEVTQHLDEIKREQVLADKVLANVRRQGCLDAPGIRYVIASLEFFNGDIALAAQTPTGELRWLLGDFTGHGLSAAIGSIPVASAFYATSKKNIPFAEVVATINDMLKGLLPPGLFCAASMLALSPDSSSLSIWNGGLPAVLLRRARDGSLQEFPSQALPLGLVSSAELGVTLEQVAVERGDEIFVYSDGLTEATNTAGELFGGERLEAALRSVSKTGEAFDHLLAKVTAFRGGARASDDVSLVTVTVGETAVPKPRAARARSRDLKSRELRPPTRPSERPQ
jgi:serine phosphatase RsbU (regulator of sigma subunit)